ncbi:DUF6731 family protein [Clostridium tarantellae]|uniref:Uncharacterized protein n=1 Tax=Clostridium tarantellae TaxID=39493 RepID=A0A6I1MP37_9CLOT|nr:DUF6731 family protein [Clostridium tarantellae]MPQ44543.1 hypothetical protein [Clostridium tarantellae]
MANKKIKLYYFYGIIRDENNNKKLAKLSTLLKYLDSISSAERVQEYGEGNMQLKKMNYDKEKQRWELCFLRNIIDAPFITKLDDNTEVAEALDEDEFIGQECCMIFDEKTQVIILQNNRVSISFSAISKFLSEYTEEKIDLFPIVYEDKYCTISDDEGIEYKSIVIGYTDISNLIQLSEGENEESIKAILKYGNSLSALSGKIEFGVGRTKGYLVKEKLKKVVNFFKKNKNATTSLKVKMFDNDNIRILDLISNKLNDSIEISVTKNDPKAFDKILYNMHSRFDVTLVETFSKCKKFTDS